MVDIGGAEPGRSRTLVSGEDIAWIRAQDWTPDGQWIVVEFGIRDRTTHIGLASTRDGSLRVLKSFGPGALVDARWIVGAGYLTSHAAVAPDGKTLAFDRWTAGTRRDVFVVALDGTAERPAVVHPADDALVGWSRDGKTLLFTSDRTGSIGLWTVPVDGATFGPPTLVMANVGDAEFLLPSAAGALPYVLSAPLAGDVLLMRADFGAGAVTSPPANVADQFLGRNSDPRWSADGKLLAYVSRRDGVAGGRVLVVRSSDTGVVREMRPALAWFSLAAWVPDSRNVMVRGLGTDGRGWYRVNTDSGATSWIGDDAHGVAFRQFSADGSSMYVDGGPTNGTIAVTARDMASGTEREVFRGPQGFPNRLALSPDGRTLYYRQPVSVATPPHDLIARDLATGTERTLVRQRKLGPVQLSPDGRFIVTTSESASKNGSVLLLIPADGGDPRELPNVGDPATISNFLAWAPDSHSILTWRVAQNKDTEYWWVPVDGREPRKLAVPQKASQGWVAQPEGHDLAFEVRQNMDWPSLWIMELQSPAGAVKSTLPSVGRGSTPAKK